MEGWIQATLGDLYEITSSKRVFRSDWTTSGVPFYRAREIVKLFNDGFVDNELFISQEMYDRYSEKYGAPQKNDLLVTGVGTLGICYVVQSGDQFYFKDGNIIWLKTRGKVNPHFIKYAFQSDLVKRQVHDSVGATVATYTITRAKATQISLPPLPEQERIVAILDEAFAAIATATANAEKNLANARELFESELNAVFTQNGDGWVEKTVEELCVIGDGNHSSKYPKKSEMVESGVPFIRGVNLVEGKISIDDLRYISEEKHKTLKKGHLKTGDVLFTNRGEIGKVAIVDDRFDGANLNSQIAWLRCRSDILSDYLFFFLQSGHMKRHFSITKSGAALQQFTIRMLKAVLIFYPSRKEQKYIVDSLRELERDVKLVEALYQHKFDCLTELKQSILHKAFAGELTANPKAAVRVLTEAAV